MIEIRKVSPEMTYPLRHRILRPSQPIEESMYDSDHKEGTFHVGAFSEDKLISVATFIPDSNPAFTAKKQYRLRQMATLENYRKKGAGSAIVQYAEEYIRELGIHVLWCKGRTSVQEYYRKMGFEAYGEVFDYPPIGPHIIMYKELK